MQNEQKCFDDDYIDRKDNIDSRDNIDSETNDKKRNFIILKC
jgi:hypothetical protein